MTELFPVVDPEREGGRGKPLLLISIVDTGFCLEEPTGNILDTINLQSLNGIIT